MGDSIIWSTAAGRSYEQPATAAAMAMPTESPTTAALHTGAFAPNPLHSAIITMLGPPPCVNWLTHQHANSCGSGNSEARFRSPLDLVSPIAVLAALGAHGVMLVLNGLVLAS